MTPSLFRAPPDYARWDQVAHLLHQSFAYMTPILGHAAHALTLEATDLSRAADSGCVFLMTRGDNPVACLFTRPSRDIANALYCGWLAVDGNERGQGLSHHLINAAETEAIGQGKSALTLDTGRELTHLHRLFSRLGFSRHPGTGAVVTFVKPVPLRLAADNPLLPEIFDLMHRSFADMAGRIDPPSSLHQMTLGSLTKDATQNELWALIEGTRPTACMILTPKPESLYLGKLAVDPTLQRRGFARRLVAQAEIRARTLRLASITLQTRIELTENHIAFRALGFTQTNATAHPGYNRPTSLTFSKTL